MTVQCILIHFSEFSRPPHVSQTLKCSREDNILYALVNSIVRNLLSYGSPVHNYFSIPAEQIDLIINGQRYD